MIFNRIRDALKRQDWTAVTLELVIVTIGVMLGIEVANWNEARSEDALIERQVASVQVELESNLEIMQEIRDFSAAQVEAVETIRRALANPAGKGALDSELFLVYRIESLALDTSAMADLKESEAYRRLSGGKRRAIAEWEALRARIRRADEDALNYRQSTVGHLFSTLSFTPLVDEIYPPTNAPQQSLVLNDPARLASDLEFRNFLASRYAVESQKVEFIDALIDATRGLIEELES